MCTPNLQKGGKSDPIYHLCTCCCKVMEYIVVSSLSKHLESNKILYVYTQAPLLDRSAPFMDDIIFFSTDGVTKLLKGVNPSKALGPDGLHLSPKGVSNRVICYFFSAIN